MEYYQPFRFKVHAHSLSDLECHALKEQHIDGSTTCISHAHGERAAAAAVWNSPKRFISMCKEISLLIFVPQTHGPWHCRGLIPVYEGFLHCPNKRFFIKTQPTFYVLVTIYRVVENKWLLFENSRPSVARQLCLPLPMNTVWHRVCLITLWNTVCYKNLINQKI